MTFLPDYTTQAPVRSVPPELQIFACSVSDDDLCAWCHHLLYQPGLESLCQHHSGTSWPGVRDDDGYVIHCVRFSYSLNKDAP